MEKKMEIKLNIIRNCGRTKHRSLLPDRWWAQLNFTS